MGDDFERIGDGITARRRRKRKVVSTFEAVRAWADHNNKLNETPHGPWDQHRPMLDEMRARWAEIRKTEPSLDAPNRRDWQQEHQQQRHSEFWYLSAIRAAESAIDHHIRQGEIGWAVHEAMLLGELITELRMKSCWEEPAMFGERRFRELQDAGAASRKGPDEQRVAAWLKHRAAGANFKDADFLAAQELAVSEATVRLARSKAGHTKKGASASD
ncbi:hypothetical protein ACH0BU_04250 [Sphingomonas olei]